ncbi:MAG: hypothetical protein JSU01_19575, partial [Bacteroidetes bacterium]|nr:hypothetical protein [Bacteroidota bacterium]
MDSKLEKSIRSGTVQLKKELAEKNRQLEIEAALERVRTVAMGMRKANDLLDICKVLFEELTALGFSELRNAMINIANDEKGSFLNYDFNGQNSTITQFSHNSHLVIERQVAITRSANDAFIEHVLTGAELEDFKAFRVKNGEAPDPRLENISALYYYFYAISDGSVGISAFSPLSEEKREVLKRFRNVFDLAYRRYVDIEQAEAQTREAQIELSLERVRASAMAMHKTDQLLDAAELLYKELTGLGINSMAVTYSIMAGDEKSAAYYSINPVDGKINPVPLDLPHTETEVMRSMLASWKKHEAFGKLELDEEATLQHQTYIAKKIEAFFATHDFDYNFSVEAFLAVSPKKAVIYTFNFAQGYIFIIGSEHLTRSQEEMVMRFTKVFEMTYRRFLDLQKAEDQAREARIENALEKVRSRSLAMHSSSELAEVAQTIFKQVKALGIETYTSGFNIWDDAHNKVHSWMSNPTGNINPVFEMPISSYEQHRRIYTAWKDKKEFIEDDLIGAALRRHYKFLRSFPQLDESFRRSEDAGIKTPKRQVHNNAFFKHGYLLFITEEPCPHQHDVFKRFAKVFDQTYTRFLDLQKAEAQARESQIQLTLERIRARTMAMQRSDELADISLELFKQVQLLGIATWHCAFNIYDDDQGNGTEWSTNIGGVYPMYKTPRVGIFRKYYEIGAAGEALHVEVIGKDRCADHYAWLCTLPGVGDQLLKLKASGIPFPTSQIDHVAYFKYGYLLFITYEPAPEGYEIFKRVAKTFEQTYTRFLDLQKAEAQAREAQIQLALERVRARTMAMQHSEELAEVIQLVFEQLQQLNFDIDVANFALNYKETDDLDLLLAVPHGKYPLKIHVPYIQHPVFDRFNQAKKKEGLLTDMLSKEEKNSFFEHFFKYVPGVPEENKSSIFSRPGFVRSSVLMKNTALTIHNYNGIPYSEAENNTLLRFGQVFDQTYTRFNDLKQAEEQAREAQIQLGLERVRARAMAMQNSDELAELVHTVFKELTKLDFALTRCIINILDANTYSARWWMANIEDDKTPASYFIKYKELSYFKSAFKAWKERNAKWEYILGKEEKSILDDYLFSETELKMLPAQVQAGMRSSESLVISAAYGNFGCLHVASLEPLSDENRDILARFGQVFDLTYTRFNDLKQAEAQARESQIQLALERVRARTMAMQKSEELAETVFILFQQFKELGENPDQATIGIVNEQEHVIEYWVTMYGSQTDKVYKFSIDEPNVTRKIYDAWKRKKRSLVIDLTGKALHDFATYRESMGGAKLNKDEKRRIINVAFFSKGLINVQSNVERSEESIKLLERFAAVFEGTYTRFLDLKQAEALAREGQIQLGLERVRAQAMAMQTSEELNELIGTVFTELTKLDFVLTRCLIMIFHPGTKASRWWMANPEAPAEPMNYLVQFHKHPAYDAYLKAWKGRDLKWNYALKGKVKRDWDDFLFVDTELAELPGPVIEGMKAPDQVLLSASFNNFGCLTLVSLEPLSAEHSDIMLRFAKVFDMSYTRFNDLKQAEEQAREAQIQLGLERVRAAAMAMHSSQDVGNATALVFSELYKLGINTIRCGVCIVDD